MNEEIITVNPLYETDNINGPVDHIIHITDAVVVAVTAYPMLVESVVYDEPEKFGVIKTCVSFCALLFCIAVVGCIIFILSGGAIFYLTINGADDPS